MGLEYQTFERSQFHKYVKSYPVSNVFHIPQAAKL